MSLSLSLSALPAHIMAPGISAPKEEVMSLNGQGRSSNNRNWLDSVGANVARNGAKYYALVMTYALLACALMANSSDTGADPCGGANCNGEAACKVTGCINIPGGSHKYVDPQNLQGCINQSVGCYDSRCSELIWHNHSNCQGTIPEVIHYYRKSCVYYDPGQNPGG